MKKRNIRGLFIGEKGQRTFNFIYSLGASVVILGALFKLLHVPGADLILVIGMGTEAAIFALSAFDTPAKDYKWERVYPELAAEDEALERLERMREGGARVESAAKAQSGVGASAAGEDEAGVNPAAGTTFASDNVSVWPASPSEGNGSMAAPFVAQPSQVGITLGQADEAAEATRRYVEQLDAVSQGLAKMQESMASLSLSEGYAEQMAALNKNLQGLNTIYEIQLKSISSQLGTIEQVNQGLNNIRSLYENGQNDSYRIRQETDQLARNLQLLNEVYARMLQAMTAGYGFQPQQAPFQQQPQQGSYQPQSQSQQAPFQSQAQPQQGSYQPQQARPFNS